MPAPRPAAFALALLASCASDPVAAPPDAAPDIAVAPDATAPDVTPDVTAPPDAPPARRPSFIVFLAEANGWTSTSVLQDEAIPASRSGTIQTPSLDRLSAQGMRFSNFYAPSPRCMPTRASLLTGRSPAALHMTFIPEARNEGAATGMVVPPVTLTTLPVATPTVASVLRASGYGTAHFGKWHAGNVDPRMYGFDASDGATANRGPENVDHPNPAQAYLIADRAIEFLDAQAAAGRPFYLQVSSYGGKDEVDARPETYAMAAARLPGANPRDVALAAVQMDMDVNIGRVLRRLDELGLAADTYVFFTSDHGAQGPNSNPPLAGSKGTVWEGGIRVPLFVRGPNVRMGVASRARTYGVDLLPTIAGLAGVASLPGGLEGGDLRAILGGGATDVRRARDEYVVHFPHYDMDPLGPASAIILGDYKLTRFWETNAQRLYNLAADLGESTDLAGRDPARVAELSGRLDAYLTAVNAQLPTRR
ncbi:MAG: sulfatase-like hydrolase/transferase [Polyangiales bacterium]